MTKQEYDDTWLIFIAPLPPIQRAEKRRAKECERIDRLPNTLAPQEDPWHPDYKGQEYDE
jgi:hypothetical protein